MRMTNTEEILKKVKSVLGFSEEEKEHDEVLLQMLSDAMTAITLFCNRKIFPWQLEYIARQMVVHAFEKENGDHVASIKRGDTQITYSSTITGESMTQEQKDICCKFRRFRTA